MCEFVFLMFYFILCFIFYVMFLIITIFITITCRDEEQVQPSPTL